MENTKPRILFTGMTGFVGAQIAYAFLSDANITANYTIVGGVRDPTDETKLKPLRETFGEELFTKIEFVPFEMNDPSMIEKALMNLHTVVHTAQPLNDPTLTDETLIKMTATSSEKMLEAAVANKVKKIILTSVSAGFHYKFDTDPNYVYSETDSCPMEGMFGVPLACLTKEKIFYDFAMKQKTEATPDPVEIVILNPVMIKGPVLIERMNSSTNVIGGIMLGFMPKVPNVIQPMVDIRDVALAHKRAFEMSGLNGERFIISKGSFGYDQICQYLSEEFRQYGYPIPTEPWPLAEVLEAAKVNPSVGLLLALYNKPLQVSNEKSKRVLGLTYDHDMKDTIVEEARSLITRGLVPNRGL